MAPTGSSIDDSGKAWRAWRQRLEQGEDPAMFIQEFPDHSLVELLKTAGEARATTRNLVLAEVLRRLSGRPSERSALAAEVLDEMAHDTEVSANATARAVHQTEAAVEAKASSRERGGSREAPDIAHEASRQVEALRDIAHSLEGKADYLMRLHRTGEFVTPGRAGEERRPEGERG